MLCVFIVLSCFYRFAVWLRNLLYDKGLLKISKANHPVISVGNITAGGTGKTPLAIELCRLLVGKGYKPAVLTRGYASDSGFADEPEEIKLACPSAEVFINPDRAQAARNAESNSECNVFILDDGFQHRRLARDLNIAAVDAGCPFGYSRLLPAGLLREPIKNISRADCIAVTKCETAGEKEIENIRNRIRSYNSSAPIAVLRQRFVCFRTLDGQTLKLRSLKDKRAFVFCGLANPESFLENVTRSRIEIAGRRLFKDHHSYTAEDLELILSDSSNSDIIVMTRKDFVKVSRIAEFSGWEEFRKKAGYFELSLEFVDGFGRLEDLLNELGR
ncbi:Tetraacyldisaccharide 4'-kinase [Sedimentisphaera cyanobacteriorum]|uniref:Tetraacyldisaccharide 4'-kinase n=2 Tax=Sedimentisphaera cyanobacteriorum TaxID=1940790 RepID=A0A1Q2HMF7_9BACT|nr:Tetraacyldisaccharide 4'-kinase [Sedimentisphaera cyanobacteriorum]